MCLFWHFQGPHRSVDAATLEGLLLMLGVCLEKCALCVGVDDEIGTSVKPCYWKDIYEEYCLIVDDISKYVWNLWLWMSIDKNSDWRQCASDDMGHSVALFVCRKAICESNLCGLLFQRLDKKQTWSAAAGGLCLGRVMCWWHSQGPHRSVNVVDVCVCVCVCVCLSWKKEEKMQK